MSAEATSGEILDQPPASLHDKPQLSLVPTNEVEEPRRQRRARISVPLSQDIVFFNQPSPLYNPPVVEIINNSTVILDGTKRVFTETERAIFNALASNRAGSITSQDVQDAGFPNAGSLASTRSKVSGEITKFRESYVLKGRPILATTGKRGGARHHMDKDILVVDWRGRKRIKPVKFTGPTGEKGVRRDSRTMPGMDLHRIGLGISDPSAGLAPPVAIDADTESAAEQQKFYKEDWVMVQAARTNPDAFNALIKGYHGFIRLKASAYFLQGGDNSDLVQEGMIGFYKGVRDYNGRGASFRNFVEVCIKRQLITAVVTSTRKKHKPLNEFVGFDCPPPGSADDEGQAVTLGSVIPSKAPQPEDAVIGKEVLSGLIGLLLNSLSEVEFEVAKMHIEGRSYQSMAEQLGADTKVVDNALQRVKRKVAQHLKGQS